MQEHNIVDIEVEDTDHNDGNDDDIDKNEGDDLDETAFPDADVFDDFDVSSGTSDGGGDRSISANFKWGAEHRRQS